MLKSPEFRNNSSQRHASSWAWRICGPPIWGHQTFPRPPPIYL